MGRGAGHIHGDGRLLRSVCDGLFRFAGVDWRGRPLSDSAPPIQPEPLAPAPARDPIHAAIAVSRAALHAHIAVCRTEDAASPEGHARCREAGAASHAAWRALLEMRPTTIEGAQALAAYVPEFIQDGAWDDDQDAATLFRTIASVRPESPAPTPVCHSNTNPELAAMVAEWLALKPVADNAESFDDPEITQKFDLQWRILAHPCWSVADLHAKLPLFHEELDAAGSGLSAPQKAINLPIAAWRAVIRDLEPLSGTVAAASDAALIALTEAAIAEERAAAAISEATDHDAPPGTFARSLQLLELVTAQDAHTPAGLAAKARVLLAHAPEADDLDGNWRCQALALSTARDAARLGVGRTDSDRANPVMVAGLDADEARHVPRPDPVFAAIEAYRRLHAAWIASLGLESDADSELLARRDAVFEVLLSTHPTTEAGRIALLEQVAFQIADFGRGSMVPADWAEAAGRIVNGGQPVTDMSMPPMARELVAAE